MRIAPILILTIIASTVVASNSGRPLLPSTDWTCPVCHQTFQFDPHHPDYMRSWTANHLAAHGSGTPRPPPVPLVPPYLIDRYREVRSRLDRVTSSQLPEFSKPSSLSSLYYALARLREIAQEELDRLTSRESNLESQLRELTDEIDSNKDRISELARENESLRSEVSSIESAIGDRESKKAAQNDLQDKLSRINENFDQQEASFRQSFYSNLRQAQSRNLIPPPSSYHALPSALPARYAEPMAAGIAPNFERREAPTFRQSPQFRVAPRAPEINQRVESGAVREMVTETTVKNEIDRIDGLVPQLVSTRRDVETASKRLAAPESHVKGQRAEIERLLNQKESVESRKASLTETRDSLESEIGELASKVRRQVDDAIRKWVVRSFWKCADQFAHDLLAEESEHAASWFETFRKVMTHTVEFGSDVFNVIGKTPKASVKDEWGELEVELNQAVDQYKLNLFLEYTNLPDWLQSLVPKGNRPWRNAER